MDNSVYKILIVEDEDAMREPLVEAFTKEGFIVASAADGIEGLSEATKVRPDLILLDINMPNMDGLTMLKELRQADETTKDIKVILITNLTPDDEIMKGILESEPSYFILKPNLPIAGVIQKVKEALGILKPESLV